MCFIWGAGRITFFEKKICRERERDWEGERMRKCETATPKANCSKKKLADSVPTGQLSFILLL